jgi:hypothetical protein
MIQHAKWISRRLYDCDSVVGFCVASSVVFSTVAFKAEYLNEARWGIGKATHQGLHGLGRSYSSGKLPAWACLQRLV